MPLAATNAAETIGPIFELHKPWHLSSILALRASLALASSVLRSSASILHRGPIPRVTCEVMRSSTRLHADEERRASYGEGQQPASTKPSNAARSHHVSSAQSAKGRYRDRLSRGASLISPKLNTLSSSFGMRVDGDFTVCGKKYWSVSASLGGPVQSFARYFVGHPSLQVSMQFSKRNNTLLQHRPIEATLIKLSS